MKFNRILFATATCAIALASCSKVKNEITTSEFDPNKTPVTSLTYIEEGSSDTKAVFEIDAAAAYQAGATSVTVFLAKDMDNDTLANGAYFQNISLESEEPFKVTLGSITGPGDKAKYNLAKGDLYIPMIRANYPPFVHSEWTKVYNDGSDRLAIEMGYGLKPVVFEQPAGISCTATDETITATWRRVPYAESYTLEYKTSSESEWKVIEDISADLNNYTIEGLHYKTPYDVRVKAVGEKEETEYTATLMPTQDTYKLRTKELVIEFFTERAAQAGAKDEFKLVNDVDMEGVSVPSVAAYAGIFNGQGFALKNLKITEPLFTENNGTICNFIIDNSCTVEPASTIFAPVVLKNNGTLQAVVNKAAIDYETNTEVTAGALIAGIVTYNYGTVDQCSNEALVSYVVNAPSAPWGIAGVCAFNAGEVKDVTNSGKVVSHADYCSVKQVVGEISFKVVGCTGGIVAYSSKGTVSGSTNKGEVDYLVSAMNKYTSSTGMNRNQIAGIVAAPDGDITNCTNDGAITARLLNEDGKTNATEYLAGVAGISGGDYFATSQNNTNITGCVNNGKISLTSNHSGSNNTAGGIVAWPCAESKSTVKTADCTNNGDIVVDGTLKGRFGGVQGGSGIMEGCVNNGNIIVGANVNTGSVAGSLCGFHSGGYALTNCSAFGSVKSEAALTGIGGLIGNIGNAAHSIGTGCVVDCELSCTTTNVGLVVGYFNGKTKAITIGTESSPIKVAGKVNGTETTSETYTNYLNGPTNFLATMHVINAVYGK